MFFGNFHEGASLLQYQAKYLPPFDLSLKLDLIGGW